MLTLEIWYTEFIVATYKLMQDIEAEDKILGPLTLRQFIFALIAVFLFYICFILFVKHYVFLLVMFLPPALFFGFFALPFGRDQPTEIWALAKLRFWFKPRQRVWNQSGVKELVTITVPKKVERVLTNGLTQTEVKSRLKALADTLDSRGWAVKNVVADAYTPQSFADTSSDRLIDITSLPQDVQNEEVGAADDILDAANNPIARQFDNMINQSSQVHRQQLIDELNGIRQSETAKQPAGGPAGDWFMGQGQPAAVTGMVPAVAVGDPAAEAELSARLAVQASSKNVPFGNLRTVRPTANQAVAADPALLASPADGSLTAIPTAAPGQASAMTAPSDPAILSLAKNDDFNVATLAREAQKNREGGDRQNEVVVSLH